MRDVDPGVSCNSKSYTCSFSQLYLPDKESWGALETSQIKFYQYTIKLRFLVKLTKCSHMTLKGNKDTTINETIENCICCMYLMSWFYHILTLDSFLQPQFHSLFSLKWIWLAELCTQCQTLLQWTVNYCFWAPLQCYVSEDYVDSFEKLEMTGYTYTHAGKDNMRQTVR